MHEKNSKHDKIEVNNNFLLKFPRTNSVCAYLCIFKMNNAAKSFSNQFVLVIRLNVIYLIIFISLIFSDLNL